MRKRAHSGTAEGRMALVTDVDEIGRAQPTGEFVRTNAQISHRRRAKEILKSHPEARSLIGRNPWTLAIILAVTALQFAIAFLLRNQPWWLVLIVAYAVGAFANHALFVMVHECTHRLVFKNLGQPPVGNYLQFRPAGAELHLFRAPSSAPSHLSRRPLVIIQTCRRIGRSRCSTADRSAGPAGFS